MNKYIMVKESIKHTRNALNDIGDSNSLTFFKLNDYLTKKILSNGRLWKNLQNELIEKNMVNTFDYLNNIREVRLRFDQEDFINEPASVAIYNKNLHFLKNIVPDYKVMTGKGFRQATVANKNIDYLSYFVSRMDLEGVKFVLDNMLTDKTRLSVFNGFSKIKTHKSYLDNKENIGKILDLILDDYKQEKISISYFTGKEENLSSDLKQERGIKCDDIMDNIYPGIILEYINKIKQMENNDAIELLLFNIESINNSLNHSYVLDYDYYDNDDKRLSCLSLNLSNDYLNLRFRTEAFKKINNKEEYYNVILKKFNAYTDEIISNENFYLTYKNNYNGLKANIIDIALMNDDKQLLKDYVRKCDHEHLLDSQMSIFQKSLNDEEGLIFVIKNALKKHNNILRKLFIINNNKIESLSDREHNNKKDNELIDNYFLFLDFNFNYIKDKSVIDLEYFKNKYNINHNNMYKKTEDFYQACCENKNLEDLSNIIKTALIKMEKNEINSSIITEHNKYNSLKKRL